MSLLANNTTRQPGESLALGIAAPDAIYRWDLELLDANGQTIDELPLSRKHFQAAIRATWFESLRSGIVDTYQPQLETPHIEPRFAAESDPSPHVVGFQIALAEGVSEEVSLDFGITYFAVHASRWQAERIRGGVNTDDDKVRYRLSAYLAESTGVAISLGGITVEPEQTQVPIETRDRGNWPASVAWDDPDSAALPVFFPQSLLQEACDEASRFPEGEVGGMLLGHLCRDAHSGEIFLEVTALVPGEETLESTESTVTFTPDSWQLAQELIRLRGRGEILVGWSHSHPFRLCADCNVPPPPACVAKVLFYSDR